MGVFATPDARPYVVSEDIFGLLNHWGGRTGFVLPDHAFFAHLRARMRAALEGIFPSCAVELLSEDWLRSKIQELVCEGHTRHHLATITLDRVYVGDHFHFALDMTRLVDPATLRKFAEIGSRTQEPVQRQIANAIGSLRRRHIREVQLVDDVVFSGMESGLPEIIRTLSDSGIVVCRLISGVLIGKGQRALAEAFPNLEFDPVTSYETVEDEICERDFYPGVPLSGRLLGSESGTPLVPEVGAPYLKPFGDPINWASIPEERVIQWSRFCLLHGAELWREIGRVTGREVHCSEVGRLPRGLPRDNSPFCQALERLADNI